MMIDRLTKGNLHVKLFLAIILILNCYVRWRLIEVPLERYEEEYAYGAQLLLQGLMPYKDIYSMKLPGIYLIYGVILKLFGHSTIAIHTGLLIVNSLSIIFVFLIAKRLLCSSVSATLAAVFYTVHNLSSSVQGIFANTEHFMMPFVLGGFFCLLHSLSRKQNIIFC